jgi:predicted secreted protein
MGEPRRKHSLDEGWIESSPNEPVEIVVRGAGSTGYEWSVEADADRVRILEHGREPAETIGGAGTERFVIEPLTEGPTQLRFELRRPWEEQAAESREVTLQARRR